MEKVQDGFLLIKGSQRSKMFKVTISTWSWLPSHCSCWVISTPHHKTCLKDYYKWLLSLCCKMERQHIENVEDNLSVPPIWEVYRQGRQVLQSCVIDITVEQVQCVYCGRSHMITSTSVTLSLCARYATIHPLSRICKWQLLKTGSCKYFMLSTMAACIWGSALGRWW